LLADGTVKVADFGVARIESSNLTQAGTVMGTPSYMSPEQLAGKKIDGRSDLFSLGVMLFQLVCGKLPFEGDSMAQLMFRIANEPHPDIRDLRP
ncbi:protein kinase, partial [Salmonella enterica subsp. enterica serovar Typhimurium]|nr:protein kinase [Salmonella enterica subsp. enterica serovar Typhimurium]